MRFAFTLALVSTAALMGACASNPEPEPTPAPVTAPVTAARPAPTAPTAPTAPVGPAAGSRADFAAKTTTRVYFDLDQFTLDDADRSALQAQAKWLTQYPTTKVQIEGNADERGTREYNLALGARRAESVAAYLGTLNIAPARVTTISYGKDRPVAPGNDEAAWSQNRNANTNLVSEATS